jgi:Tfp pilus assembly protein PilX
VLVVVAPVAMSMARTVTEHDREYNPYIDRDRATAPGIR